MDFDASQKIQAQLSSGESLLWSGRPRQGMILRGSDIFVIPFSLLWGGFAVFWEYTAYTSGAPIFFLAFGGVFVVAGIYFIFGRFAVDALVRRRTYYGISNDRVIIVSEFPALSIESLALATLSDVTFNSGADQSGSISFGAQHPMASMFSGLHWPGIGKYQGPRFDTIEGVKSVHDILQRAKRERERASR